MSTSRRQLLLAAIVARVQAVQTASGFQTDAGQLVFFGETPELGPDDPNEAIAVVVGDEEPKYQGANLLIRLPVSIQAVAKADLEAPWLAIEAVIADIKTAVELADRKLGGLIPQPLERGPVRTMPRAKGSTTVGVSVQYLATYVEGWGTP